MTNTSYHQKLSLDDKKPICSLCNEESLYYCTMNDEYYCVKHVLGHDENEYLLYFLKANYLIYLWKKLNIILELKKLLK